MNNHDFVQKTLEEINQLISSIPRKKLLDLHYCDLYQPEESCLGLYFIESPDGKMLYIGKVTSRTICERIGAHFDSRVDSILNSLPKKVFEKTNNSKEFSSEELDNVIQGLWDWAIAVLFVMVDNVDKTKHLISKAESLLIFDMQPPKGNCINGTNRKYPISTDIPIGLLIP